MTNKKENISYTCMKTNGINIDCSACKSPQKYSNNVIAAKVVSS